MSYSSGDRGRRKRRPVVAPPPLGTGACAPNVPWLDSVPMLDARPQLGTATTGLPAGPPGGPCRRVPAQIRDGGPQHVSGNVRPSQPGQDVWRLVSDCRGARHDWPASRRGCPGARQCGFVCSQPAAAGATGHGRTVRPAVQVGGRAALAGLRCHVGSIPWHSTARRRPRCRVTISCAVRRGDGHRRVVRP